MPSTKRGPFILNAAPTFDNPAWLTDIDDAAYRFSNDVFNVMDRDFGAVGDGSTNDRAAVQAAVDAAQSAGRGAVYFPRSHKINSQVTVTASNIWLVFGPGAELVQGSSTGNISIQGSEGSTGTLTAIATQGDTTLTMGSTAGLAAGDFLSLYSSINWPNTTNSSKQGEIVRVKSVDSGTVVTLWGRIEDTYAFATANWRKLTMLEGCGVSGGKIRNPTPGTLTLPAITLKWAKGFTAQNMAFQAIDGQAYNCEQVVDSTFDNLGFYDLTDDVAGGRFGYGVSLVGACQNNVVSNCHMRGGRHLVTHGGSARGVARHNRTQDCTATGMTSAGFDTHIESSHNTFSDCEAWGQFSTTEGYGFSANGPYTTIMDCRGGFLRNSVIAVNQFADRCVIIGGRYGPQITGNNVIFNQGGSTVITGGTVIEDSPSTAVNNDTGGVLFVDQSTRFVNASTPIGGTAVSAITWNHPNNRFAITYSASMTPDMRAKHQVIVITNGTAFTINNPTSAVTGQELVLELRNTSGGAHGAITWGGNFKMGGALAAIATGNRKTISFVYTGSQWLEMSRAAADIPN